MSQKDMVLGYLMAGKTLTAIEALNLFGCMSLSQRVGNLKRAGHPIQSETITLPNKKRIARYSYAPRSEG